MACVQQAYLPTGSYRNFGLGGGGGGGGEGRGRGGGEIKCVHAGGGGSL